MHTNQSVRLFRKQARHAHAGRRGLDLGRRSRTACLVEAFTIVSNMDVIDVAKDMTIIN